jgi:uncharacterized membrane protein
MKYLNLIRSLAILITGITMLWLAYDTTEHMAKLSTVFLTIMGLIVLVVAVFEIADAYKEFNDKT